MNPPHQPTEATRAQVRALTVAGIPQDEIASIIGIAPKTLRLHYRADLDHGLSETIANVADSLVRKALNGDTASAIFFLKVRGKKLGWSERLEVTGDEGGPIETRDVSARDILADRLARLAGSRDQGEGAGDDTAGEG